VNILHVEKVKDAIEVSHKHGGHWHMKTRMEAAEHGLSADQLTATRGQMETER
jgi:hypothetical protein